MICICSTDKLWMKKLWIDSLELSKKVPFCMENFALLHSLNLPLTVGVQIQHIVLYCFIWRIATTTTQWTLLRCGKNTYASQKSDKFLLILTIAQTLHILEGCKFCRYVEDGISISGTIMVSVNGSIIYCTLC